MHGGLSLTYLATVAVWIAKCVELAAEREVDPADGVTLEEAKRFIEGLFELLRDLGYAVYRDRQRHDHLLTLEQRFVLDTSMSRANRFLLYKNLKDEGHAKISKECSLVGDTQVILRPCTQTSSYPLIEVEGNIEQHATPIPSPLH
jgi:hypothetical protein